MLTSPHQMSVAQRSISPVTDPSAYPFLLTHDSDRVDDVDMAYWQGHGWPFGLALDRSSTLQGKP